MKMRFVVHCPLFIMVALFFLVAGCGITGKTLQIVMQPQDFGGKSSISRLVQLQYLSVEPNGTSLISVGAYPWGEYSEDDRRTLESSINASLNNLQLAENQKMPELSLHIKIRRHLVAFSNNEGAVLACVAWCVTISNKIIYSEQFYASAGGRYRTVGSMKNEVHRGIVKRLLSSAVILANEGPSSDKLPSIVDGTYSKFTDAIAPLPVSLTGTPPPGYFYVHGNPMRLVPWSWAEPSEEIDWQEQIR